MSDPVPRSDDIRLTEEHDEQEGQHDGPGGAASGRHLPPEGFPESLLQKRLGRLDTRRALADLCKSVPGLDELLLPRGIQADALTRKAGGGSRMIQGLSRRIQSDSAAWDAFRTAVRDQIPPETFDTLSDLTPANLEERASAHTTEGLLLALVIDEDEPDPELVSAVIGLWADQNSREERKATKDARVKELESELERLKTENNDLTFASRAAQQRAESLSEEVKNLSTMREKFESRTRDAESRASQATGETDQLRARISDLEGHGAHLERALDSERRAYSKAAERVDEMHGELGRVIEERDRIRNALRDARFTDRGFGELLVRSVKNEVGSLPNDLESASHVAKLLEFMGKVLQAHDEARASRESGGRARSPKSGLSQGDAEDSEPSPTSGRSSGSPPGQKKQDRKSPSAFAEVIAEGRGTEAQPAPKVAASVSVGKRPTLSFRALGGAGEVGGSSHLLDFGRTKVLVDAGIKPDGRGSSAPAFDNIGGLDAAVITHAHLDHCGALPLLVRSRPDLPIYCTPPSAKLIINALGDHAAMGGSLPGGVPIHEVKKRLTPIPFGKPFTVGDAKITLTESGHLLGAASVLLQSNSAMVFHTGDICMEDHFSIPSAKLPEVRDIDLLIMEATLADQQSQPFTESVKTMIEVINDTTLEREGSVLIPTYALGQAQEIILGLKHFSDDLDRDVFIYVDGSVVTTSERLYAEQIGYMKPYLQQSYPREVFFSENIRAVSNDDRARERILTSPCAIIASPVTMQGGASAFYRKRLEKDEKNAVILPSNAAAAYGSQQKLAGEEEKWRVEKVNFAAHCTQDELLTITEKLSPRQIILIHGSKRRISGLAFRLSPNHKIHTPSIGETVRTVL